MPRPPIAWQPLFLAEPEGFARLLAEPSLDRRLRSWRGYEDMLLGEALRAGLPSALIENRAGQFRAPSRRSIAAAVAGADWEGSRHFSLLLTETADAEAYPISATVYALMPREPRSGTDRILRFFDGALTHWQQDAVDLDYVPLPGSLVERIRSYWEATSR